MVTRSKGWSLVVAGILVLCAALAAAQFGDDPESEMYNNPEEERGPTERVTIGVLQKPATCTEKVGDGYTVKVNLKLSKVDEQSGKTVVLDKEKIIHVGHGHFLEGVESGLLGACKGEKRSLRIPSSLGFGDEGSKKLRVPPNTDLRAVVEVLDFVEPDPYGDDEHHHHEDEDMDPVSNEGGEEGEEDDHSPPIGEEQFFNYVKKVTTAGVEELQQKKHVLVMFYAPWCGHCTSFKPKYAKLANAFASESGIDIAAVDGTEDPTGAEKYGVEGFPTIILFKKGGKRVNYEGERTVSDLVAFLNGETGSERLANGRLSDQAGTVAELNQLVLEWKAKTRSLNELAAALPKGSYYQRVLEGIEKNGATYVAKEKARLSKLYQDGHAPIKAEQLDSIQRRINILDVFDDE